MTNESKSMAAAYFLLGLAAGGTVALLMAPCAGKETRAKLKAQMDLGKSKLAESADQIKQKSTELYEQAADVVESGRTRVMGEVNRIDSALQAGKEAYKRGVVEA